MKRMTIAHEFVDTIPENLAEGKLYISIPYATAVHQCCCGCESEVVTPFSPTDWKFSFNGETVSLDPSIGSWNLPCQSHYWIQNNSIQWARQWTRKEIDCARTREQSEKEMHYEANNHKNQKKDRDSSWWSRLFNWSRRQS